MLVNGSVIIVSTAIRFVLFIIYLASVISCFVTVSVYSFHPLTQSVKLFAILAFLASPLVFAYGVSNTLVGCSTERFECVSKVPYKDGFIVAYRKYGFAFTSDAVLVRKEMPLLPGMLYVKEVWFAYPSYEVRLEMDSTHLLRILDPNSAENSNRYSGSALQKDTALAIIDLNK